MAWITEKRTPVWIVLGLSIALVGFGCATDSDEGSAAFRGYAPSTDPSGNYPPNDFGPGTEPPSGGTNVSFGGFQDIGFRRS